MPIRDVWTRVCATQTLVCVPPRKRCEMYCLKLVMKRDSESFPKEIVVNGEWLYIGLGKTIRPFFAAHCCMLSEQCFMI